MTDLSETTVINYYFCSPITYCQIMKPLCCLKTLPLNSNTRMKSIVIHWFFEILLGAPKSKNFRGPLGPWVNASLNLGNDSSSTENDVNRVTVSKYGDSEEGDNDSGGESENSDIDLAPESIFIKTKSGRVTTNYNRHRFT